MMNDAINESEKSAAQNESVVHVHFLHQHVPAAISNVIIVSLAAIVWFGVAFYNREVKNATEVFIQNGKEEKIVFTYGSWPALQNADFFNNVKNDFIRQGSSFIEADLSAMVIRFYQDGNQIKEAPIQTKGRDGSWWETPAGLYQIATKEKSHFSSFGNVYMPWSMQFQGNFFIHGPTHYPDGTPTSRSYSGGCIRIGLNDAEEFYKLAKKGTPVLVFEQSFNNTASVSPYQQKRLLPEHISYLAADLENNFVFAANDVADTRALASITKLMAALVAVEYINVEREVTIDDSMIVPTSIPRLREGDRISILDLLSLLLLESSNEAALAITNPLGERQFINLMNTKAEAIGMKQSHFADTSGMRSDNSATAEDLFALAKYLYHNRSFVLHMSMGKESRAAYEKVSYNNLKNLNVIAGIDGMVGGKTGKSTAASDSMFAVFEMTMGTQKRPLVIIVLGSDDAKRDIQTLFGYVRDNFDSK